MGRSSGRSAKNKSRAENNGSTARHSPRRQLAPFALAAFGGVVAFLGFAGFDVWPLAFVAYVPLFAAIDLARGRLGGSPPPRPPRTRRIVGIAWLFGFVGISGGYYWIVEMLEKFSGFATILNVGIASILFAYLGGMFALFGWLWHRATERGFNSTLSAVAAWAAVELVFPNLFPFYYGASFHPVPLLMQIADLGGPILVSALCIVVNGALYELLRAGLRRRALPRAAPVTAAALLGASLVYGGVRMQQLETDVEQAPKLTVGMVQTNMGIFAKREDPFEGHRRHVAQTLALEEQVDLDLVVWPESAYGFAFPGETENLRRQVMGPVRTPLLFGGLARRNEGGETKLYNTAYLLDGEGDIRGTYDKTYLLAFGEYIPFGDMFPVLYDMSPNTGHFTPGDHVRPLEWDGWRISSLICYEDILPGFVREAVSVGDPHLLVNITNDAWFGDTTEPWIHLALAKFRAIEHRRYLVRSTNSGVSAVVDPTGDVVTHIGVFERGQSHAEVAMLQGSTLYAVAGNWAGWLGLAGIVWLAFVAGRLGRAPRNRSRKEAPQAPTRR